MLRTVAVQRIKDGLAFRTGTTLDTKIILRLQEAQRDLEAGKTLPKFLLQEAQTLSLAAAAHTVAIPSGFIRENDDKSIYYTPSGTDRPTFLKRIRAYKDAVLGNVSEDSDAAAPKVYVVLKSTIDFIITADQAYTLYWDYYKRADVLTADIENDWLGNVEGGSEWLIGEAGFRIAADLRDKDGMGLFDALRQKGRAASFGSLLALEESGGPVAMGEDN